MKFEETNLHMMCNSPYWGPETYTRLQRDGFMGAKWQWTGKEAIFSEWEPFVNTMVATLT